MTAAADARQAQILKRFYKTFTVTAVKVFLFYRKLKKNKYSPAGQ
jgi:hypothetical protein